MKKTLQFFISSYFIFLTISVSAQNWQTIKSFGSSTGSELVSDMILDNQGNTIVTGIFEDTIVTSAGTVISNGGFDIFLAKLDTAGNVIWIKSGGSTGGVSSAAPVFGANEITTSVDIDQNGDIYIAGNYAGTATFDNFTVTIGNFNNGVFLAKYDANGTIQWIRTGTTDAYQQGFGFSANIISDIEIDTAGNIHAIGFRNGAMTFGTTVLSNTSFNNFIIKYDVSGNLLSADVVSTGFPQLLQITDSQLQILCSVAVGTSNAYRIFKYDFQGNLLGNTPTLTPTAFPTPNFVLNSNEDILLYRQISNSVTSDLILTQFDSSGNLLWSKNIVGTAAETKGGLAIDDDNNVYISASFNSSSISIDTIVIPGVGDNIFVAKFDSIGQLIWIEIEQNNTKPRLTTVDTEGDIIVLGDFSNVAFFDSTLIQSNGLNDVFYAKLGCEPRPISQVLGDTVVCLGNSTYEAVQNSVGNTFLWTVSGGGTVINNGNTATINWTQTGTYTITVAQTNDCGIGKSFSFDVTVKDVPILPIINGDTTDCLGSSTYNVTNNLSTDTYSWTVSGGGNLFPIGNTAIINWAVTGNHVLSVTASNVCGISPTGSIDIDIFAIPSQPSPISGNTNVCASTQTYTVPQVNSVQYNWSLSSGGTITTNGNIATINWTTAGTHTLSVIPSNDCGVGSARSILVTVTEVPQQPSTVVGNLTVCKGLQSYSVIGNTTTAYNWTISGGGNLTFSNSNATINWQTAGTYTMTITPSNVCGVGTPRTVTVTVLDVPSQPNEILGLDTVCIGTQNYSVVPQNGVNYNWQLSSGGTVLPNNNLATINWTTPGTHTITVTPSNSCGSGQAKSRLVVVKNTNAQISSIAGEDNPCLDIENYSVPNIAGLTYNWSASGGGIVTGLGNTAFVDWNNTGIYTLSVVTSDGCSNSLTVSVDDVPTQPSQIFGDTTVCLGFYNYSVLNTPDVNYTWTLSGGGILTQSGNAANVNWTQTGTYILTATPFNDCGVGTARSQTITVLNVPNQPSTISTTAIIDTLACITTETYSIAPQSNVTYNFSLSGNGILVQNQNSADITWLSASADNELIVTTSNICGTSPQQSLLIDVLDIPQVAPIQGDNEVCLNTTQVYAIPTIAENSYNWSLSSGGVLTVVNDSAIIDWQTTGTHTLTVTPTNICGIGQSQTLQITVKDTPVQPLGFTGSTSVCQTIQGYSINAVNDVSYNWNLSSGGSIASLNNAANINWTTAGTHTISITPSNECGVGTPLIQPITVQSIPSQPTTIIGLDSTCLNTLDNYSTIFQNGLTYNWNLSNGGVLSQSSNTSSVNWTAVGNQTLSVTASNVCGTSAPQTKNITVLNVPTQPSISGDFAVCLNDTETYIATSNGTNYTWSTTGGNVSANTINWTTVGNQTLTVTPSNFCGTGTATSVNVFVNTIPNISQNIAGDSVVCLGISTYSLPQVSGVNYSWTISGGGSITALNNSASINWTTAGTYTITVIPSNECGLGNTITKQITVNTIPAIPTTILGADSTCLNTTTTFSTTLQSNVIYNWNVTNSSGTITPNINNTTINWNTTGVQTISVTAANSCGISNPRTKDVTVLNVPTQPTITGDFSVCLNDTETYIATSNGTNYTWSTTGGIVNGNDITWTTLGNQSLTVTPTNFCGNGASTSVNIAVETVPTISQNILGDSVVCPGITAYTFPQLSGVNYTWSISGGGSITSLGNAANINWITAGTYTITVIPSNNCGNGLAITKQITVRSVPNQPSAIQGADTVCTVAENYSVLFENGITYNWTLGSGGVLTTNGNVATIVWTDEGTHTIIVTPQNVCGSLGTPITKTVTVQIAPNLTAAIDGEVQVCNGETAIYSITTSIPNLTYNWTIDNGNSLVINGNQAIVDFSTIGNTTLSVSVSNQCGNSSTKSLDILVENNAPNILGEIIGDTLVCRNSDAVYTINGNSDFDYNWFVNAGGTVSELNNSSIISWQTAGSFEVGVYASNFCGLSDTVFTNVMVENPLQRPQITLVNDTLFSSNRTLSQWYYNGNEIENATDFAYRPINSGVYYVESENICGVTPFSNDFSFGLESGLFLYPNPGRYFITLRVPPYLAWYSVDAIDQQGRIVMQPIYYDGSNEVLLDVRDLAAGVYWFRIETELILLYRKVVILN